MSGISHLLDLVADDMRHVEDKMRSGIADRYPDLAAVVDYLMGAGGKRLRPVMALMAANFHPERFEPEKAYAWAAAVEMLHTATLVHDDLIDNSLFRRGMPTLNVSWSPAATILTGDYLFARAAELASETDSVRITRIFAQTLMTMVGGELQQLFNDGHQRVPNRAEYEQRIYAKTASLFAMALQCGGMLWQASPEEEKALHDYGNYLGMAFQVVDDILDFVSDEDTLGKPVASDLRQGIATLPVMLFDQKYPDHPIVLKAVRREKPTDDEINEIVQEITDAGCIQETVEEAKNFARQALNALEPLPHNPYRQAMQELVEYAVARDF